MGAACYISGNVILVTRWNDSYALLNLYELTQSLCSPLTLELAVLRSSSLLGFADAGKTALYKLTKLIYFTSFQGTLGCFVIVHRDLMVE